MKKPIQPLFLARHTYRERRTQDAARLLPVLGIILLLFPLFWAAPEAESASTSGGIIYLFSVWIILIAIAGLLSRRLDELAHGADTGSDMGADTSGKRRN